MSLTGDGERHGFQNTHILPSTNCRCASEAEVESPEDTQVAGKKKRGLTATGTETMSVEKKRGRRELQRRWMQIRKKRLGLQYWVMLLRHVSESLPMNARLDSNIVWLYSRQAIVGLFFLKTMSQLFFSEYDELFFDYNAWVSSMISLFFFFPIKWNDLFYPSN